MWYCLNCKSEFEEPRSEINYVVFDPYPMGYHMSSCPHCGWDDFVEAIECNGCGKNIVGEYIKTTNDECYCEDCYTRHDNTEI